MQQCQLVLQCFPQHCALILQCYALIKYYFQIKSWCANEDKMTIQQCDDGVDSCLVRFDGSDVIKRDCNNGKTDLTDYDEHEGNYVCKDTKASAHKDCYCKYINNVQLLFIYFLCHDLCRTDKCNDDDDVPKASGSVRMTGTGVMVGVLAFVMARM